MHQQLIVNILVALAEWDLTRQRLHKYLKEHCRNNKIKYFSACKRFVNLVCAPEQEQENSQTKTKREAGCVTNFRVL